MTPDIITTQVAFATGRIIHQGTGESVSGEIRLTSPEGPIIGKVRDDGTFALSGYLQFLFPDLASQPYQLTLTIRAVSAQYRAGSVELTLPPQTIPAGANFDPLPPATVPTALIDYGTVVLPADPLIIRGRVVEAEDPSTPIAGATVEILHGGPPVPAVTTGADGRYRFNPLVLTAPTEIRCAEPVRFRTITRNLLLDYGQLVNEENFRLPPL